jgi:hypothetical protein
MPQVPVLIVKLASSTGAFQTTAALVYDGAAVITGLRSASIGVLGLGQYYVNGTNTPYFMDSAGATFGVQTAAGERPARCPGCPGCNRPRRLLCHACVLPHPSSG